MEQFIKDVLANYDYLFYLVILGWTFLEGETVVLLTGALASEGSYNINLYLLTFCAFLGSFCGDQAYFYIGRRYGTPLLKRWPALTTKIDWAFRLLRNHETLFILSFRFIYGVRNVSPFVIGMSGVSRLKFFILNAIAAFIWANTFVWGGYLLGRALETWLGENKVYFLLGFIALAAGFAAVSWWRQRRRTAQAVLEAERAERERATEAAPSE